MEDIESVRLSMCIEVMSEEETDLEEEDQKKLVRRKFAWEGEPLRRLKEMLDQMHLDSLSAFQRNFKLLAEDGPPVDTPVPAGVPTNWVNPTHRN